MTDHNDEKKSTTRRNALALLGVGAVGGATATAGFSQLTAEREIEVGIEDEDNAVIKSIADNNDQSIEITNQSSGTIETIVDSEDEYELASSSSTDGAEINDDGGEIEITEFSPAETVTLEFSGLDGEATFEINAFSDTDGFGVQIRRLLDVREPLNFTNYWPMDEGEGGTAADDKGDKDITLENGDRWGSSTAGYSGTTTRYTSSSHYYRTERFDDASPETFGFYMWVRFTSSLSTWDRIVRTREKESSIGSRGWQIYRDSDEEVVFTVSGGQIGDSGYTPETDVWYMIGVIGNGDDCEFYIWDRDEEVFSASGTEERNSALNEPIVGLVDDQDRGPDAHVGEVGFSDREVTKDDLEAVWENTRNP